jgi:hypothetical protein
MLTWAADFADYLFWVREPLLHISLPLQRGRNGVLCYFFSFLDLTGKTDGRHLILFSCVL